MKITKQRLKQIIKEELHRLIEAEQLPASEGELVDYLGLDYALPGAPEEKEERLQMSLPRDVAAEVPDVIGDPMEIVGKAPWWKGLSDVTPEETAAAEKIAADPSHPDYPGGPTATGGKVVASTAVRGIPGEVRQFGQRVHGQGQDIAGGEETVSAFDIMGSYPEFEEGWIKKVTPTEDTPTEDIVKRLGVLWPAEFEGSRGVGLSNAENEEMHILLKALEDRKAGYGG